jgi:PKD domain
VGTALVAMCVGVTIAASSTLASPGWSAPADYPLPGKSFGSTSQIGYQAGGTATIAYLEVISLSPLQTVLHAGVVPPGGAYQEQLRIASAANSIPADVRLAEAPDGAAVLQWSVLQGSEPETSPVAYIASYRASGSGSWEAPSTVATDATRKKGIGGTLVPAISSDGTAAAGVEHLDPSMLPAGGYRIDVAVHPSGGSWGTPIQISPPKDSGEGPSLALGFDANGDLTAAFRVELAKERNTLAAERRPASSGVWGSLEDVTGSDITSNAYWPALGVSPDGSAVIGFQYVHNAGSKTLDVNAVTRYGATGSWTAPVDVAVGGASSGPMAAGVSPTDEAYLLYRFQGGTSSGEDCVGAVSASAGNNFFTAPHCVSPTNFNPGSGGVAFLGNDAYFAWSGQPNGGSSYVAEGSRWLDRALQPESFTNLDAPAKVIGLDQLVPDEDGSVAAFWSAEIAPGETKLRAAAFDAGPPNLLAAGVPASAVAGQSVVMSASFADLWSGLGGPPSWSFGDGSGGSGAQVSHTYSAPGAYTVTLTASDGLGNQTSSTYPITVASSPVTPSPVLRLLSSKVVGREVLAQLSCTGAACTGEALLRTRERLRSGKPVAVQSRHAKVRTTYRTVVVGASRFALAAGQTLELSVGLNSTGRKLLTRFKKLPVTLEVVADTRIAVKHLTILSPKHSAKHKKR